MVHLFRADLNLDPLFFRADDRGVQALIHVGLGHGDVILELARHGFPQGMHQSQHGVAFAQIVHDHPEGDHVKDLITLSWRWRRVSSAMV